jgi:hypothetical protein
VFPPVLGILFGAGFTEIMCGIKVLFVLTLPYEYKKSNVGVEMFTQHPDDIAPSLFMPYGVVETKNNALRVGFHSYECIGIA